MTNDQVHSAVVRWLHGLLGIPVWRDRQQQVANPPFAIVDLANWGPTSDRATDIAFTQLDSENSEGKKEVAAVPLTEVEWVFLLFFYGEQGQAFARRLQSGILLTQVQEPLRPGLIVHSLGQANNVPELVGEVWEDRTQINLVVRGVSDDGFVIDTVEEHAITITGEHS